MEKRERKKGVGGRLLPTEPSSETYRNDPYRGQRRRPWGAFRYKNSTIELSELNIRDFFAKAYDHLREAGLLIDEGDAFLTYHTMYPSLDQAKAALDEALEERDRIYEPGLLSIPIFIVVHDGTEEEDAHFMELEKEYREHIYMLKFSGSEASYQIRKKDFRLLKESCEEFSDLIANHEGLPESRCVKLEIVKRPITFGKFVPDWDASLMRNTTDRRHEENQRGSYERRVNNQQHHHERDDQGKASREGASGMKMGMYVSPPPGIGVEQPSVYQERFVSPPGLALPPPPGLHLKPSRTTSSSTQEMFEHRQDGTRRSSYDTVEYQRQNQRAPMTYDEYGMATGEKVTVMASQRDGDGRNRGVESHDMEMKNRRVEKDYSRNDDLNTSKSEKMIMEDDVEAALTVMDSMGDVKSSENTLATQIAGDFLFNRFSKEFNSAVCNYHLLVVVNYACGSAAKGAQTKIELMINEIFERRFTDRLVTRFIQPCVYENASWTWSVTALTLEMVHLFDRYCSVKTSVDSVVERSWNMYMNTVYDADEEKWVRMGASRKRLDSFFHFLRDVRYRFDELMCVGPVYSSSRQREEPRNPNQDMDEVMNGRRRQSGDDWENETRHGERGRKDEYQERTLYEDRQRSEPRDQEYRSSENYDYQYEDSRKKRGDEPYFYEDYEQEKYRRELEEDMRRRENERISRNHDSRGDNMRYSEDVPGPSRNQGFREETEMNTGNQYRQGDTFNDSYHDEDSYHHEEPEAEVQVEQPKMDVDVAPCLWEKCERIEPPNDFRTLSTIPKLRDIINPVEPYIRRIREDGVYRNADHYLDVQFRLMREDLLSPMRDGIDIYKKNGTTRRNRLVDTISSDIQLFTIQNFDGVQVSNYRGEIMRYAKMMPGQFENTDNSKVLQYGQLVMISSDGFERDVHLGIVENNYIDNGNRISFTIVEETSSTPLQRNRGYQVAEASSYLISYRFVLDVLKGISRFSPMSFERYLVHGKKNVRRPAFHMQEKEAEQLAEEKRIEKHYNEVRSLAVAKRLSKQGGETLATERKLGSRNQRHGSKKKNQKKGERNSPDYGLSDDGESSAEEECKSGENSEDEETRQLAAPIFPKPIGYQNVEDGNRLTIGDKEYNVDRLLTDFQPTNMDESQRVAFCKAMTSELAIIQGPPGTGKTHIGVEIVKGMLMNRRRWKMIEPILIVCYTNTALDQFLERVYMAIDELPSRLVDPKLPRVIRFGSKSESEFLKKKNTMKQDAMRQFQELVPLKMDADVRRKFRAKREALNELCVTSFGMYASHRELTSFLIISRVMPVEIQREIKDYALTHVDTKGQMLTTDEAFACWLLDRNCELATKTQSASTRRGKGQGKSSRFVGIGHEGSDEDFEDVNVREDSPDKIDDLDVDAEKLLDSVFAKINLKCNSKQGGGADVHSTGFGISIESEYKSDGLWDIHANVAPRGVLLLSNTVKPHGNINVSIDPEIEQAINDEKFAILKCPALSEKETEDIRSIFSLARPKRWALFNLWCIKLRTLLAGNLPKLIAAYRKACKAVINAQNRQDAFIARHAMVIGATTTGAARLRKVMEQISPKILIVEEAAEVFESHILTSIVPSIEHAVMIGDHQQLRPSPSVDELGRYYGLEISMFERLVVNNFPFATLQLQHRMNTNIADVLVRKTFYPSVQDADSVKEYPPVKGLAENLFFWSHQAPEYPMDGVSYMNGEEIRMACSLVKHLLRQGYLTTEITIITTYAAQRGEMRRAIGQEFGLSKDDTTEISVETVDSYQGRENKIIIVSLVRSQGENNENFGVGFLGVKNRICVALTRAMHGMYILGNGDYLAKNSYLWKDIVENIHNKYLIDYSIPIKCDTHANVQYVSAPREFDVLSPEGGCQQKCSIVRSCGHDCRRICHPSPEIEHERVKCDMPCEKRCSNERFSHACKKKCYEDCGKCSAYEQLLLDCGHNVTVPCFQMDNVQCDQRCSKILECQHQCVAMCGQECTEARECPQKVELPLECGHMRTVPCYVATSDETVQCEDKCEKRLMCEHQCAEKCGRPCSLECNEIVQIRLKCGHETTAKCRDIGDSDDEMTIECKEMVPKSMSPCDHNCVVMCTTAAKSTNCTARCEEKLEKCGHTCRNKCGLCHSDGNHICQANCEKMLGCGHKCSKVCGEECGGCDSYCQASCSHMTCGLGRMGYGRKCKDLCVLCTKPCDNKCIHRSCTKKCYEECNVKACNEPCNLRLERCGHACLGMCGEVCPVICGTCDREKYRTCVSVLKGGSTSTTVRHLIRLPCNHTFPVEYLDELVRNHRTNGTSLDCPDEKCGGKIEKVKRYAKTVKRRSLDAYMEKVVKLSKDEATKKITKSTDLLRASLVMLNNSSREAKNNSKRTNNQRQRIQVFIVNTNNRLAGIGKEDATTRASFYGNIAQHLFAMTRLVDVSCIFLRILHHSRLTMPPRLQMLISDMCKEKHLVNQIEVVTDEMLDRVDALSASELCGVTMMPFRFQICRLAFYLQLTTVLAKCAEANVELNADQEKPLRAVCNEFIKKGQADNYITSLQNLEKLILTYFPFVSSSLIKLDMLELPEF